MSNDTPKIVKREIKDQTFRDLPIDMEDVTFIGCNFIGCDFSHCKHCSFHECFFDTKTIAMMRDEDQKALISTYKE